MGETRATRRALRPLLCGAIQPGPPGAAVCDTSDGIDSGHSRDQTPDTSARNGGDRHKPQPQTSKRGNPYPQSTPDPRPAMARNHPQPPEHPRPSARIGEEPPNTVTSHPSREQHRTTHRADHRAGRPVEKQPPPGPHQGRQGSTKPKQNSTRPQPGATKPPAPTPTPAGGSSKPQPQPQTADHSQPLPPDAQQGGKKDHPLQNCQNPPHQTTRDTPRQDTQKDRTHRPKFAPGPNTRHQPKQATPTRPANSNLPRRQTKRKGPHPHKPRPPRQQHTALHQRPHDPATRYPLQSTQISTTAQQPATTRHKTPRHHTPTGAKADGPTTPIAGHAAPASHGTQASGSQHPDHQPAAAPSAMAPPPPRGKPPHNTTPCASSNSKTPTTHTPSQQSQHQAPTRESGDLHQKPPPGLAGNHPTPPPTPRALSQEWRGQTQPTTRKQEQGDQRPRTRSQTPNRSSKQAA